MKLLAQPHPWLRVPRPNRLHDSRASFGRHDVLSLRLLDGLFHRDLDEGAYIHTLLGSDSPRCFEGRGLGASPSDVCASLNTRGHVVIVLFRDCPIAPCTDGRVSLYSIWAMLTLPTLEALVGATQRLKAFYLKVIAPIAGG